MGPQARLLLMMERERVRLQVEQARDGDQRAFAALVLAFRPRIERFCARMVAASQAADLAQDVFLRAFAKLADFSPQSCFLAWLYAIARNRCLDVLRRAKRREKVLLAGEEQQLVCPGPAPGKALERDGLKRRVRAALDTLAPELREIVALHHLEGMPFRAAAEALGVPVGTAKTRARRAMQKLSHLLREDAPCSAKP